MRRLVWPVDVALPVQVGFSLGAATQWGVTVRWELVELLDRHADASDPGSWVWDALHLARLAWVGYRDLEDMVDPVDEGE